MLPKDEVYWFTHKPPGPSLPLRRLDSPLQVPVAIVGGGMAGLMCAQRLKERKVDCIVLESSFCGSGASGKSSGFITPDSELELSTLVGRFGPSEAKRLWDFATSGVRAIEETIRRCSLSCDYQKQDSLFVASTLKRARTVQTEFDAHRELGYESEHYRRTALPELLGSQAYYGALRTPGTFGMSAYLYCQGLKAHLEAVGVRIYEETAARSIDAHRVQTDHHLIRADKVVVAADLSLAELGILPQDIYHAQTFLAVSRPLSEEVLRRLFPSGPLLVWDTDLIYQYYRQIGEGRLLLGAASLLYTYLPREKHEPAKIARKMRAYVDRVFPGVLLDWEYLWPGMLGVSKDFLPLLGKHPGMEDVYFIGAAAGLPWAAALGGYMADKLVEGREELDWHFSPDRHFPIGHGLQAALGKPVSFALSHGVSKYLAS